MCRLKLRNRFWNFLKVCTVLTDSSGGKVACLTFILFFSGIHPTIISESFQRAAAEAEKILLGMSKPVDLNDDELLVKMATTSLNSKVGIFFFF